MTKNIFIINWFWNCIFLHQIIIYINCLTVKFYKIKEYKIRHFSMSINNKSQGKMQFRLFLTVSPSKLWTTVLLCQAFCNCTKRPGCCTIHYWIRRVLVDVRFKYFKSLKIDSVKKAAEFDQQFNYPY